MITLRKKYTYIKENFMEYKTCKVKLDIQYHQFNNYDLFINLSKSFGKDGCEKQKVLI